MLPTTVRGGSLLRGQGVSPASWGRSGFVFNAVHRTTLLLANVGRPNPFFKVGIVSLQLVCTRTLDATHHIISCCAAPYYYLVPSASLAPEHLASNHHRGLRSSLLCRKHQKVSPNFVTVLQWTFWPVRHSGLQRSRKGGSWTSRDFEFH
jgi:hypothetical protein